MRKGCGLVQTWHRMKQLLRGRFSPPTYERYNVYAYQRFRQGSRSVNECTTEFFRLAERNRYQKVRTNPRLYKRKGENFLTIVHDPSSLLGECKETREVHLIVVKVEVESKDLVGAYILVEMQTLLDDFDDMILENL